MIIKSKDINCLKWNACILNAQDPLFYFLHEVLDAATLSSWSAVIEDDYKNVFPLTFKKKYSINYLSTPTWIQRLGWINNTENIFPIEAQQTAWIDLYAQNINQQNIETKTNYILPLNKPCTYSNNHLRNLKKAKANGFSVVEKAVNPIDFVDFFKQHKGKDLPNLTVEDYNRLIKILEILYQKKLLTELWVINNNVCLAKGMFVTFGKRYTYFKGCITQEAANTGAGHLLLNEAINKAKEKNVELFDFYGGNTSGMAQYYQGFGAKPEHYFYIQKKKFATLFSIVKKIGL